MPAASVRSVAMAFPSEAWFDRPVMNCISLHSACVRRVYVVNASMRKVQFSSGPYDDILYRYHLSYH